MSLVALAATAWFATVVVTLRTMAIARHADEAADRHWEELTCLRSASGVAFFPTRGARRELERAIRDLIGAAR